MFGYVRPLKGELKVRDYELYQAAYCGLCRQLKKRHGFLSTLMLSYDLTFLATLFMGLDGDKGFKAERCAASPFRKKNMCCFCPGLETAADVTVVLGYEKLRDDREDSKGLKSFLSRAAMLLFKRSYKRASSSIPGFAGETRQCLERLAELEREKCTSIDAAADAFARILSEAGRLAENEHTQTLKTLLYHVGRWVYLADAADDLSRDVKNGDYNCVAIRYGAQNGELGEEQKASLKDTLDLSASLAGDAAEGLELGKYKELIMNILDLGMPFVAGKVLQKQWHSKARKI